MVLDISKFNLDQQQDARLWGRAPGLSERQDRDKTETHLGTLRYTKVHSGTLRYTRVHSGTLRYTKVHSGTRDKTETHSGTLRYTQVHSYILNGGFQRLKKV